MTKTLYPYQREDVEWLKGHLRCILGSEMGVGKTTEVLHLCKELGLASVLVVCPKSLIPEWENQIEEWLGKEYLNYFLILNYEKLRRIELADVIARDNFDLICFDECHRLKNPKAKQTLGAMLVTSDPKKRVVLVSGTPMQNGPQDLFSILRIVEPQGYKSYRTFIDEYCITEQLPKPPFPRIIIGVRNQEQLKAVLHKHMLRRLKREVLADLPPKIHHTIPVELVSAQHAKYLQMEEELFVILDSGEKITAPAVMAQIMRLRQLCLEPNLLSENAKRSTPSTKTRLILDLIDDSDSPVVVYTYFEKYTRILADELTRANISHALYTGATANDQRYKNATDFQAGKYKVLIGTITSMGLGLTLTSSHTVIFADWWWNPAVNDQAIDRLHRIGQKEPVEVIDLWAKGTIEDAMHQAIKRKKEMVSQIVATEATINELRRIRRERR